MKNKKIWYLIGCCGWILIWQIASMTVGKGTIVFAGPIETLIALGQEIRNPEFWIAIMNTSLHILEGFLAGLGVAVVTAALSYRFLGVRIFLAPLLSFTKSVPVAAFVVIALLWVGAGGLSVLISAMIVFPIFYAAILKGLDEVDEKQMELASIFHFSIWRVFWEILRPAVYPYFEQAATVSFGMAWKSAIAAEVITIAAHSIGEKLYDAKIYFETATLFAWMFVIVILSYLTGLLVRGLIRLIMKPQNL